MNPLKTTLIFVSVLLFFGLIYFYLFNDLKCETCADEKEIFILENHSTILESEEVDDEIGTFVGESGCKITELTRRYNDKYVNLTDKLDIFYHSKPNSTQFPKIIATFKNSVTQNETPITNYFTDGRLIEIMKKSTLLKADNSEIGTMLKIIFTLPNQLRVIFKPKWYRPHEVLYGVPHYKGKDRHFGEVVSFYLSILLNFNNVPVAAIRKVDIDHLAVISDRALLNTFLYKDNHTCFYGICRCCDPANLVCADNSNTIEGSVVVYLPSNHGFQSRFHPWSRTFICNVPAIWEWYEDYCLSVRSLNFFSQTKNAALFFDIMDGSVFDFLIDNGDRHELDYIENNNNIPRMILLDNGRSFANPYIDHIDILAPLYQCCLLRNSTWNTLLDLRGGNLSYWLRHLLVLDPDLHLRKIHFKALDRRLLIIFAVLEDCFDRKGKHNVIINY